MAEVSNQEATVLEMMKSMSEAFQTRNLSKIMSFYKEEAKLIYEPGKEVDNPKQIEGWYDGVFLINPTYDFHDPAIIVCDDVASFQAIWTIDGKRRDGSPIHQRGVLLRILRKTEDGDWKIIIDNPHAKV